MIPALRQAAGEDLGTNAEHSCRSKAFGAHDERPVNLFSIMSQFPALSCPWAQELLVSRLLQAAAAVVV